MIQTRNTSSTAHILQQTTKYNRSTGLTKSSKNSNAQRFISSLLFRRSHIEEAPNTLYN